jgi:hypothetical protein
MKMFDLRGKKVIGSYDGHVEHVIHGPKRNRRIPLHRVSLNMNFSDGTTLRAWVQTEPRKVPCLMIDIREPNRKETDDGK